eukprot:m.160116 g.160116  ORF g.160116 m.160116 type:complete len:504 (+) comp23780_c0_seq7:101-1612(+)
MSAMMDLEAFDVGALGVITEGVIPVAAGGSVASGPKGRASARKSTVKSEASSARKRPRHTADDEATASAAQAMAPEPRQVLGDGTTSLPLPATPEQFDHVPPSQADFGDLRRIGWGTSPNVDLCKVLDDSMAELPPLQFTAYVDKGFKPSSQYMAFICQKKNHFQVSATAQFPVVPKYIVTPGGVMKIERVVLKLHGIKTDDGVTVALEQSLSDRTKKPFDHLAVNLNDTELRTSVCRLHFTETTANNMRKRSKPNPDQRYFAVMASLMAIVDGDTEYPIASVTSDRIIVRASNPGQFEAEMTTLWTRAAVGDGIYYNGMVGIHNANPDEALCINGNLAMTGTLMQPSDRRIKDNLRRCDGATQLENVRKLTLYKYDLRPEWAASVGIEPADAVDHTGVIAQELAGILPDAVKVTGDRVLTNGERIDNLLVVNKDRLLMEGLGALQQLATMQDETAARLLQVEVRNAELRAAVLAHRRSSFRILPSISPLESYMRLASILFSR